MGIILLRLFPPFREANIRDFVLAVPAKVEIHNPPRNSLPLMEQLPLLLMHFPLEGWLGSWGQRGPSSSNRGRKKLGCRKGL